MKDLGLRAVVSYWGMVAPVVVAFALLGAALWQTRARRLVVLGAVALVALWVVTAFTPVTRILARPLIREDALARADAVYVLSSSVRPSGEPSAVGLTRATRALELLGAGLTSRVLLTELGPPSGSYVEWVKRTARGLGMAHAEDVESVGIVYNTHDEALRVAALFRSRGWRRLLLVTSPTHTRRAAATFERAGVPEVVSVPAMDTDVDIMHLSRTDERIFAFGAIVHEWIGLWVYRYRGWM